MAGTVAVAVGVGVSVFPQAAAVINKASGTINEITRGMELPSVKYTLLAPRSVHAFESHEVIYKPLLYSNGRPSLRVVRFLRQTLRQQRGVHPVFCVIYKFTVKAGCKSKFRYNWVAVTQWNYRHAGSFGSRLHRANGGDYIGYAQWASCDEWKKRPDGSDAELQSHLQAMRESCEEVEVLHELDVTDDYLQSEEYSG